MREVVLFLCHLVNDEMFMRYAKLQDELSDYCDVYWVFQTDNGADDAELRNRNIRIFDFSFNEMKGYLGYTPIVDRLIPGSLHFVTEYFFHMHPDYNYYWLVEYDAVFTGNWGDLIAEFTTCNADLITSYIREYKKKDEKSPWLSSLKLVPSNGEGIEKLFMSFNPVCRMSYQALDFLDRLLRDSGNQGHAEILLPTILCHYGFKLVDFGGTGPFVPEGFKNRFYIQDHHPVACTNRWRPLMSKYEVESRGIIGKLFHPVKC